MKKMTLRLALLLAVVLCMVWSIPVMAENANTVDILFLVTSDMHGQIYATDYTADVSASGTYRQGLTRIASYIKEMRAQNQNVFLADAGDTIQGTPLSYYYAFYKGSEADPCIKAMRALDYDMWVVGNHEFNYGMEILQHQLSDATAPATETEDSIAVSMANYLDSATNSDAAKNWDTWMDYEPYRIYDYDGVKVAVMGIGNPNIAKWDVPANWEGIYFANPIETYLHYEAEMDEQSDVIVIVSHSGIDSDADSDFMRSLVSQTSSIDLVFSGHEHRNGVTEVANAEGEIVPILSPSSKCNAIAQARVTVDKTTGETSVAAESVSMRNYAIDAELEALLTPYEQAAWNDYMLQPIGKATGNFSAADLGFGPSAFVDLVNRVQIWGAYDNTGLNTPDDPSDDTPAQLSITAPLTSGNAENLIAEGDIMLGDMFRLYRYENWFYQITMSGKEVRTWLEYSASKLDYNEQGELVINEGLTYYDIIGGDGFSYDIDLSAASGSRISSMTYNGVEVKDDDTFTVVINNYRYNGGGDAIKYLNAHGCNFTPNDEKRVIYSTQYDMVQGEDLGQARNLLAEYIRQQGEISPDITSTWKLVNNDSHQLAILSTTDMHGRSTALNVATQKDDTNNMERVATVVNNERETFDNRVVVIDAGDTIQGTLTAQYAINYKADVENPMLTTMKAIGYDVWVMGNHEFNFTPEQRDAQTRMADAAGISVLSGNIVAVEDGVDFRGKEIASGASYYDPYAVKTITFADGKRVRVGVIGLSNAANHTWDLATNYPNLQFSSLDNPDGVLALEVNRWAAYLKDNDLADIVVVAAHSGLGSEDGSSLESQSLAAAKASHNVDLFICGHDHSQRVMMVENADGQPLYIINGGGSSVAKAVFNVEFDENGAYAGYTVASNLLPLSYYAADEALTETMKPWYDETYAWASAPLGTFDNGWTALTAQAEGKTNNDLVLSQTALLDFVHKGQIWCSWQSYEDQGIEGATVSIGSAVFGTNSNRTLSFVPQDGDTISTLELSKLYRYSNNLLCAVDMTPAQLYGWMSAVADMLEIGENGQPVLGKGVSIYGVDTFYGVDYTFDLTKPKGERVVSATIGGVNLLDMEGSIRTTLNSYRLSGGYGFYEVTGLSEADCCWTANTNLGADRAPVPTQLGEYVAHMGTVTPNDAVSHGYDSTWTIVTK